ncbi:hypothetical protein SUGI_0546310 [Cryptomeria japonica]|nr:hypothetical protein SUGI_0546310 [Cryptomeria japonica]
MVANKRDSGDDYCGDFQEGHHLRKMVEEGFYLFGAFAIGDYLPFLKWLDLQGLISTMKKLQKERDAFMQKLVNENRMNQRMHAHDFIDLHISRVDNNEIRSDNNDNVVKATALVCFSYPFLL